MSPESPRRAAIVTGAARGIGAAAALALHAAGSQVATFDVLPASVADSDDWMHVVADVSDADTV